METKKQPIEVCDIYTRKVKILKVREFNLITLHDCLVYFQDHGNPYKRRGNFVWKNNVPNSRVIWKDDPDGKFYTSFLFDIDAESNRFELKDGLRTPVNRNYFVAGGVPYKYGMKEMKGGGAVFMKQNELIDPDEKPIIEWKTNQFCCTYSHRPAVIDEYCEDMLMMCIYYSCQMFFETNADFAIKYYEDRGFVNYLFQLVWKSENIKKSIFWQYKDYINEFGYNEKHDELLYECAIVEAYEPDQVLGSLFLAGGFALLGKHYDFLNKYDDREDDKKFEKKAALKVECMKFAAKKKNKIVNWLVKFIYKR